jgi:hypothetical protein
VLQPITAVPLIWNRQATREYDGDFGFALPALSIVFAEFSRVALKTL